MSAATLTVTRAQRETRRWAVDGPTVMLVMAILLYGLIMVASASVTTEGAKGNPFAHLQAQLIMMLIGLLAAAVTFNIPCQRLERWAMPMLIVALVMLALVLIPGIGIAKNGSRRWLHLWHLNFQVSEAARVLVLVYIASYAVRYEEALRGGLSGLARPVGVLFLASALLLVEPDMGAGTVLFITGFGILFLAGARWRWVLMFVVLAAGAMVLLIVYSKYRMNRVTGFLDPWADPLKSGFQLTQSLMAIGRGGLLGVGLGGSVQKLFYLPEADSDFLLAVLAEELGLIGVVLTLVLFLALAWRALLIGRRANEAGLKFQSYLASGFGLWVGAQAFIHIGVNMGALPTKGLTLPLMSFGRSSLLVTLAWLGAVMRVHHETVNGARRARPERS